MNAKLNILSKHKENRPFCAGQATRTLTAVITVLLAMTAATAQARTVTIEGTLAYESDGITERRDVIGGTAVIRTGWHELEYYTSWTYNANDYSAKAVAIPALGYKVKEWLVNEERDRNDVLSPRSSETSIKQISADVKLTAVFMAQQWNPSVSINGWNYGSYDAEQNAPTLSGTPDDYTGTVIYKYATDAQAADADWSTTVPVKPGTYYVKAIAGADNNYSECTSNTTEFNIGKRLVTLDTSNYNVDDKYYDGTDAAAFTGTLGFSEGMIINNDQVSIASVTGHFASKDVVYYAGNPTEQLITITEVVLGGTDAGNYEVDLSGLMDYGAILPKTLTVTAKDKDINYGDYPTNDGVTYDGFIDGENENVQGVLSGELDFDYNYAVGDPVGDYDITPQGLSSNNYDIVYEPGILTVEKATLSIDWDNIYLTYNGSAQVPEPIFYGLLNQDVDNVSLDIVIFGSNTTSGEAVNVGEYTATVNGIEGSAAGNYNYDGDLEIDFEIEPKELTVSGSDISGIEKEYDHTTDVANFEDISVRPQGIVIYDDVEVTVTSGSYASANAGDNIEVTIYDFVLSGYHKDNYSIDNISSVKTTGRINPKSVKMTKVDVVPKVYDGGNGAEIDYSSAEFDGVIEDDIIMPDYIGASYDNVNVGTGIRVTFDLDDSCTGLSGRDANNYTLDRDGSISETVGDITKAPLTVTANDAQVKFGNAAPAFSVEYGDDEGHDFVNNEGASVLGGSLDFDCSYTQGDAVGEYDITPKGLTAANYEITFVSGTLKVVPAELQLFAANSTNLWATYCDNCERIVPDGCTAWTVTGISDNTVTVSEITGTTMPAYTALLVSRSEAGTDAVGAEYYAEGVVPTTGYDATTGLAISASTGWSYYGNAGSTAFTDEGETKYIFPFGTANATEQSYILKDGRFVMVDDKSNGVAAHRCWLNVSKEALAQSGNSNARSLDIIVDDETTAIESEKVTVNSEKFAAATVWYTIDGRRLTKAPTQKGIYIHNGKKVVMK